MGMDVYGKKASNKAGEYFRNSVWSWRPLWHYCVEVAPVASKVIHGQSNDGDGLDADDSRELAAKLREELDAGRVAEYAKRYAVVMSEFPRRPCIHCNASGTRSDAIGLQSGFDKRVVDDKNCPRFGQLGWCNGCGGWGSQESHESMYPFSVENVAKFAAFLEACGGFAIN